ncbi:NADPH:quinone oxidoreductase family protein [Aquidulcibacter sp.]|uniref:NADPH:quinone oxidoreductase family protein n=1 Tax=Aquidulcibacter sp. TaxID=2052990 RepID=UPI0025BE5E5C|nr:NADPH:quinone oxidoreductase family protein [Aquidulcibacter sp.]MCA3694600.1 NADPH:quinone oxidoreductase family protein [Aquidulcibacter sp.]
MRAFVCHAITDDLTGTGLADLAMPEPRAGEVLIAVRATSVNFPDILMCQGKYQFKPDPPFVPGLDCAGEIVALGEGVTDWSLGDEVIGGARMGGFAEFVALPAAAIQKKPPNLSWEEAAAFQAAYLTAYVALVRRANLQAGETLLVHGAAGGVGLAAVQLGLHMGARVIATSASSAKLQALRALGVEHTVLVQDGFREAVKALSDGRGADVVFDPVGGDVFDESVRCMAFDGRLLVIGFTSGRIPTVSVNMPLIKGFSVMGVRAGEYGRQFPERGRENVQAVYDLVASGSLKPHVGAVYGLTEVRAAFDLMVSRQLVGKAVIVPEYGQAG